MNLFCWLESFGQSKGEKMGITFKKLYEKLIGSINVIPASFAKDAINDALRDIYDVNDWGFLWTDGFIKVPEIIDGTAVVLENSRTVILDAPTKILVDAISIDDVPLGERQLKFYGTNKIDQVFYYTILDYDSVLGKLTIDPPFLDNSNVAIKLQILKVYYSAPTYSTSKMDVDENGAPIVITTDPVVDFRRFAYIFSPFNKRNLILDTTEAEINNRDPYRTYRNSDPRYFIPHGVDSEGTQLYELYPMNKKSKIYRTRYLRNGIALTNNSDTISDILSSELVLARAKQKAYEWVIANAGQIDSVKSTGSYLNLIAMLNNVNMSNSYPNLLEKALKKDEELFPKAYLGDFFNYPYFDNLWGDYDMSLPHDGLGDTIILDISN